jgi:hypothetical protein
VGSTDDGNTESEDVALRRESRTPDDCELVEPRGRFTGREAIIDHIAGFFDRFPGATVDITTEVDEHNGFARYGEDHRS